MLALAGFLFLILPCSNAVAQNWGDVEGRVTEISSGEPIPGVTVVVDGTNFGTATDADGRYDLRLPVGRYALRFSAIGYQPRVDSVMVQRDQATRLEVALAEAVVEMGEVTVEDHVPNEAGVYDLSPEQVRDIPAPFHDGLRALKTLPGVATNNELSSQYSVRGGGYNENLIFINGFEVYLPFRPRQGEQEGLSLLNPEMTERITLYTGGFPARYGGKLSSALAVRYYRPEDEPLNGSAYLSTLDAGAAARAGALDGRLGWSVGVRKARARRFFATQELKGNYQPDYTDLQGYVAYRLAPGHELEALGMWADHEFLLDPRNRKTYFGTVSISPARPSNLQGIWTNYDDGSEERAGYTTRFAGVRLSDRLSPRLRMEHDVAFFETEEREYLDLRGFSTIYQVENPQAGDPDSGSGHLEKGRAFQQKTADNRVRVQTWTGQGRWRLTLNRHAAEVGWSGRMLTFQDRLNEKVVVRGNSTEGDPIRIVVDSLRDSATLDAYQAAVYVQDAVDLLPQRGRLVVTGGVRADHFSFNGEWTVSPRLSAQFHLAERTTLNAAWGVYYQAPTYRELRGEPAPGEGILGALNRDLKSQRSVQWVAGLEHMLAQRRLYVRAEAYYKHLTNVISYDVENVRVLYSGENDARGYVYGLDLQLRGEFVPGLESWVNYGFMVAREDFLPAYETDRRAGVLPRPTDQRHTISVFVQDYVPSDPTWKIHLRALVGSGLPYTPPVPGESRAGNIVIQVPGDRFSERYPLYRRLDMGVTKALQITDGPDPITLYLGAELLNVFDMTNTVAYAWVPRADGIWQRIPTRLTPRTLNVRARIEF